jgi:hypothetical protein
LAAEILLIAQAGLTTKLVGTVKCNTIFNISLGRLVTDLVAYKIFWEVSGKTLHDIIVVHSTTIFTFDPSFVTIYLGLHSHLLSLWNFNFFEQLSRAIFVGFSSFTFGALDHRVIRFHWLFRLIGY